MTERVCLANDVHKCMIVLTHRCTPKKPLGVLVEHRQHVSDDLFTLITST